MSGFSPFFALPFESAVFSSESELPFGIVGGVVPSGKLPSVGGVMPFGIAGGVVLSEELPSVGGVIPCGICPSKALSETVSLFSV